MSVGFRTGEPSEEDHDSRCESEWESGAMAYTPCGCAERMTRECELPACPGCDSVDRTERQDYDAGSWYASVIIPCQHPWHDRKGGT